LRYEVWADCATDYTPKSPLARTYESLREIPEGKVPIDLIQSNETQSDHAFAEGQTMKIRREYLALALCGGVAIGEASCNSSSSSQQTAKQETEAARERAKKVGDEVSEAVKNVKPELNKAGEKLGHAARTVADDAEAAARGVQQGWDDGQHPPVDLNTASQKDLTTLPGIGPREAQRIIASRPYKEPLDAVRRGALTETEYKAIQDRVTTK